MLEAAAASFCTMQAFLQGLDQSLRSEPDVYCPETGLLAGMPMLIKSALPFIAGPQGQCT